MDKEEDMRCCGNCEWYDIIQDIGGVCSINLAEIMPCERTAKPCKDWKLCDIRIKK